MLDYFGPAHGGHDDVDHGQRDRTLVSLRDLKRFVSPVALST